MFMKGYFPLITQKLHLSELIYNWILLEMQLIQKQMHAASGICTCFRSCTCQQFCV